MRPILLAASPPQELIAPSELAAVVDRSGHVTLQDGRAFIPLASRGCGIGCKYCYIASPASAVEALPEARVRDLLQTLGDHIDRLPSASRPILAIGCDTEIAISRAVLANAMMCLDFATELHLPVQVATKFPLPDPLLHRFDHWPIDCPKPIVFTTITTMLLSSRLEPNAPTPEKRSANFRRHGIAWRSFALIKPFLETSHKDRETLLELLMRGRPDGIVVGVRYRRARASNAPGDVHPVAKKWIAVPPSVAALQFVTRLTELGFRVFMNTQCASAWHNASSDGLIVKQKYPHLCVNCGACG
jgi:hypothetical protein